MIVKKNGMTYDDQDPRCQLFLGDTSASGDIGKWLTLAFITVVDDSTGALKRYFGVFDWATAEANISNIMDVGGKWPGAFANKALPEEGELWE